MKNLQSISPEMLRDFRRSCTQNPIAAVAARAASKTDLYQICYDPEQAKKMRFEFSLEISTLPAADQQASGRCWIFAALNLLREKVAKDLNLETFQLSQNYISFYDHLEKANTFLEHILETADASPDDRYVSMLLTAPLGDGGWFEYFAGLCRKYGAVPLDAMPETYQSSHTDNMNSLLCRQLRKDALLLRKARAAGQSPAQLRTCKQQMLAQVYRLLTICLGVPPETFDFEYTDKAAAYHADRCLTPKGFYDRYLGQDLDSIVTILNAPSATVPYYKTYVTAGEESIYGSYQAKRLNLPMEEFKAAVIRQLQAGQPVWFVCDSDYDCSMEEGIWDTALYDCHSLLGLDLQMEKGDLLEYRQCTLNHAMVLTGVNLVDGVPDRWKAENSWGEGKGRKGYFVLSDAWFDRYVFTASIDLSFLTARQQALFFQPPEVLPPWNMLA